MNDYDHDQHDHDGPRRLGYGQVMPIVGALQSLAKDGPTPEVRAQANALAAVRVLFPSPRHSPERQHAAYVEALRALLRAPLDQWPVIAHPLHNAVVVLLDDAGELSDDELDRYFPDTDKKETP
jgi:hypothetical protein